MSDSVKVTVESLTFPGMMRPKPFFAVRVECFELGMTFSRYVKAGPFLLRWRLARALRKCKKSHAKMHKFILAKIAK